MEMQSIRDCSAPPRHEITPGQKVELISINTWATNQLIVIGQVANYTSS